MGKTNYFEAYRALLLAFVQDPSNGYRPEGREILSITTARNYSDFWTVKIFYKDEPDAKPKKRSWLVKEGPDTASFDIFVEEVAGWMWVQTQLQIKTLTEKVNAQVQ